MKREKERMIPSGNGLPRGRRRSGNIVRKGMAYFLCFLMLMGNIQTVSFAEENAKEIAENLGIAAEVKTEVKVFQIYPQTSSFPLHQDLHFEYGQDHKSALQEAFLPLSPKYPHASEDNPLEDAFHLTPDFPPVEALPWACRK